jgi:hypothetical protein
MEEIPFIEHRHDKLELDRNTTPIPDCKVVPILQNGKVIKAVDVPMLGCASIWLRCQQEAEKWISGCDGKMLDNRPELMNARINAAYAYLWLTEPRFRWAGLAAFASKQIGCGFLHTADLIRKAEANVAASPKISGVTISPGAVFDSVAADAAKLMKKRLAKASRDLFLDIYPLHRFYTLRGLKGIQSCLIERQAIKSRAKWGAENQLPFGVPFGEIRSSFEAIERGDVLEGARQMIYHEQVNVLQPILYNDTATRALLDANQLAWVTELPSSGYYQEIQLTLSAECKPRRGIISRILNKSLASKLYDKDQRMEFVYQATADFDALLRKKPTEVKHSIECIFLGHAIR